MISKNKIKEYKDLFSMGMPLVLNTLTATIISLVDQSLIGHISVEAFGVIGVIGTIINSIAGVIGMLAVALHIKGATYHGQEKEESLNTLFYTVISMSIIIGVCFFLLSNVFMEGIISGVLGFDHELAVVGKDYLGLFSLTMGLNLLAFIASSIIKIWGKTVYILVGNMVAGILNVFLDYILIYGFGPVPPLGVRGAALASVISIIIGLTIMFYGTYKSGLIHKPIRKLQVYIEQFRDLWCLTKTLMIQEMMEYTFFTLFISRMLISFGTSVSLATYGLLSQVLNLGLMPMYAFGSVAMTKVSQNKRDESYRLHMTLCCLKCTVFCSGVVFLVIILFGGPIFSLFTKELSLVVMAKKYMPFALLVNAVMLVQHLFQVSLQSIGKEKLVLKITVFSSVFSIILMILSIYLGVDTLISLYLGLFFYQSFMGIMMVGSYTKKFAFLLENL